MKDSSVQKLVTRSDDGSYDFNWNPSYGALNDNQFLAQILIEDQHGCSDEGQGPILSTQEREVFRATTGYNLVQAGGGFTFVGDNGEAPSLEEDQVCMKLFDAMGYAKQLKEFSGDFSDLTNDEIQSMLKWQGGGSFGSESTIFDTLMKAVKAAKQRAA